MSNKENESLLSVQLMGVQSHLNKFINKIDSYNSRNYILENVSIEACYKKWDNLLKSKFNFS